MDEQKNDGKSFGDVGDSEVFQHLYEEWQNTLIEDALA